MITPATRPLRSERVLKQESSGTVVLLGLDDGQYYALNEVGGRVWEMCDGNRNVAEMVASLTTEYEAPGLEVESDVLVLLTELVDAKLVHEYS